MSGHVHPWFLSLFVVSREPRLMCAHAMVKPEPAGRRECTRAIRKPVQSAVPVRFHATSAKYRSVLRK